MTILVQEVSPSRFEMQYEKICLTGFAKLCLWENWANKHVSSVRWLRITLSVETMVNILMIFFSHLNTEPPCLLC